jgi:hypothetical protein
VDVMWIATDPDSRRLSLNERRTSEAEYVARIEALLAIGEGYSEVHTADRPYPRLALSFRAGYGVVHQFAEDRLLLLVGGGVIHGRQTARVPMVDDAEDGEFSGDYVLTAERAWEVVKDFLRHGAAEDLGEWQEL